MLDLKLKYLLPVCIIAVATAGCATNVPELIKKAPPTNIEISQVQLKPSGFIDSRVRWGGSIVALENFKTYTLMEILERPLSSNGKPDDSARSKGRFLARIAGFLDPEEYPKGRLFSVTGRLTKNIKKVIGEYLYDYPVVETEAYHLWPEVEPYPYPYPYYRDPFYYPWYPYRHPYYW